MFSILFFILFQSNATSTKETSYQRW